MGDGRGKVRKLIERATNSTAAEVDPRLLKAIKSLVRYSDSELKLAARTLMDLMKRDHSQVRYLTLLIIDELFMRSKVFRSIIVESLDQLLSLSVGFRTNLPLPAPPAIATVLREKAIEFLEKWNYSFGVHYRQIRLGVEYLKNTLRLHFPNIQENAARTQRERREREMRTQEILKNKFNTLTLNFPSIKQEIQSTMDGIGECLEIVQAEKETSPSVPLDYEDFEEYRSAELMQIRLDSLREGEKVHETSDNKVVFDALRELYKLLETKHLVSVREWISVLIRVDLDDNRLRDSILKEFISIQNEIQSVKNKCIDSGCTLTDTTKHEKVEEEDFWEEGKIESAENESSDTPNKPNDDVSEASVSRQVINEAPESSTVKGKGKQGQTGSSSFQAPESSTVKGKVKQGQTGASSIRDKLLAEAPVVKWGSFLDNWGSNRDFMANQRGLELENHWGRVDPDAIIPAEKIAELNLSATLYEEKKAEIRPCNAPLRKGGLCPRRDRKVCPFHGPIIPRDNQGNPIDQNHSTSTATLDSDVAEQLSKGRDEEEAKKRNLDKQSLKRAKLAQVQDCPFNEPIIARDNQGNPINQNPSTSAATFDSDVAEQLAKQAVRNVRVRDEEDARKRKLDKQSLKRAKLAKIREHNASVLRDAAIASTPNSAFLGEDLEMATGGRSLSRNGNGSLASMLRKKPTAKDRLAQKLLNTKARDGTVRQITSVEDATYREAFPNQW